VWVALQGPVICIDPGHPSEKGVGTHGKVLTEVGYCWTIAQSLEKALITKGYRVVMTKHSERQSVTNKARAEIANKAGAVMMLRLHCDDDPKETGFATFYADRQGKDGKFVGPPLSVIKALKPMATAFHSAAIETLKGSLNDRHLRPDTMAFWGKKYGALIGSIHCKVPSILVEMCVLNHSSDEKFAQSAAGQKKLVEALVHGVDAALAARGKTPLESVGKR